MTNHQITDESISLSIEALELFSVGLDKSQKDLISGVACAIAGLRELQERRKTDSQAQATLNRLAVILHGSEVDLNLLTVTAQSLMDRCKAGNSPVTTE
ncbi:hypothetical protein ABN262_03230 [Citrobacter youngae]|uniref:hypothetical protein n=1 Tax=Citrobacter TaxID=544 RepID=UPI0022E73FA1|nr:hypothetical protein [Citrobacter youngae]MDL4457650.1 hypothetical protein [Citrobacter youngae]